MLSISWIRSLNDVFQNLACDFLGERLAVALGLKAAKYQYAIDQYHREHKVNVDGERRSFQNKSTILDFSSWFITSSVTVYFLLPR